jgi:HEAT repeat protein
LPPAAVLSAGLVLLAAGPARSGEPPATPGATVLPAVERFRGLLRDAPLAGRVGAARALLADAEVAPAEKAALLLDVLRREVREPTGEGGPAKSYLSATEWARSQYTRTLAETGPAGLAALRRAAREETGEVRERAVLALGYAGQGDAVPALRDLLRASATGEVRAAAAWILGNLRSGEAVPELEAALADPYEATVTRYGRTISFFPVREQALGALEALGREVLEGDDGALRLVPAR